MLHIFCFRNNSRFYSVLIKVAQLKHRLSYFEETSVEKNVHDKIGNKVENTRV